MIDNHKTDTDVLIVGAGPVGLFLANECARRGLRFRLVEARSSQSEHSKALAIFPRTMEIFDMAGIVGPFLEAANRVTSVGIFAHGRRLAHMPFEPKESPYPFIAMVPQDVTERLLVEHLVCKGGAVEYNTTFVSAVQHVDCVSVTLERHGQRFELTASFVVGCDGAHSAVRHLLKLPFEGGEYGESFLLADVEVTGSLPADELQLCPSELGPLAIFPMSVTRRRIVGMIDRPEGDQPSMELVQRLLNERGPGEVEAHSLQWSAYFRIHHRHVTQMRAGRIFVAGDAAHIHSPFGGQGMNTGLQDVWNLAWKLDLFLQDDCNEMLLDSYTAERIPVIKSVIEFTHRMTKVMGTPSHFAQTLRDTVIPMVSRLAPFQHAFVEKLSELGIDYHGSPIVEGSGERYLDDSIRGGNGILSRFLLLEGAEVELSTVDAATRLTESLPAIVELRRTNGKGVTLVRPDGYIGFSARHVHGNSDLEEVKILLERLTS